MLFTQYIVQWFCVEAITLCMPVLNESVLEKDLRNIAIES